VSLYKLSKSTFIRGLQCEKNLYLYKYHPELADEVSESQQAIFTRGTNVGVLAQRLFPGGANCAPPTHQQYQICIQKTKAAIEKGATILYEAGFIFDEVLVICDILVKQGHSWKIFEVKSSTSISEVYLNDAALQYYVIKNSLQNVNDISIVFINNQYVRNGELDINQVFTIESIKDLVNEKEDFIKDNVDRLKKVIAKKIEPKIDIGPYCSDPYECGFLGHCWKHIPDYSIFNISHLKSDKKFDLYTQGIINITDVPDDYPINDKQRMQIECERNGKEVIDKGAIDDFLSQIEYPIAFMDFETFMPAVPMFDNSRPYQQIVFQYSVHYLKNEKSEMLHKEYLAEADLKIDPRIGFLVQLIKDVQGAKTIIVYNQGFEGTRLNEIERDFPKYEKPIQDIICKVLDLMKPFQNKNYYKPEMKGSYSIKKVLPALVPELSYENMEIGEGGSASIAFESLYYESDHQKIDKIRKSLLEYCKMDTFAMVKIFDILIAV
jgi:Domain of unknown function(DUF2779)